MKKKTLALAVMVGLAAMVFAGCSKPADDSSATTGGTAAGASTAAGTTTTG
jgi:hypothetical protein